MAIETDFNLQKNAYTSFDASTLKDLILKRLTDDGKFTDQLFEGSNINAVIDIISYSYHTLLFYLNQTSSESLFSEATLYENMNRIVKLIDYKPTGFKTSLLAFKATGSANLPNNLYTIPRYSFFIVDGVYYSFNQDVSFAKTTNGVEKLTSLSENSLLYQGRYFEFPEQVAIGEEFETVTLSIKDINSNKSFLVDHDSVDVYVENINTGAFTKFNETNSLFAETALPVYEKRINENGFYEIKFGDGIFGNKLNEGDKIYIFYLKSDGQSGEVSSGKLDGNEINFYTSALFQRIQEFIYKDANLTFLTPTQVSEIAFLNEVPSTQFKDKESVEEIEKNSPKIFSSQDRLVVNNDFTNFIEKRYSNIVRGVNVVNNRNYINGYMTYFYNLGFNRPNDDPRFLLNQLKFSSSSEINNIYIFLVPKFNQYDQGNIENNYLTTSQKNTIINSMEDTKLISLDLVPVDPIYQAFGIGLEIDNLEKIDSTLIEESFLVIEKNESSLINDQNIIQEVNNIFINYFKGLTLGKPVSILTLKSSILSLQGVVNLKTRRVRNGSTVSEVDNISLLKFNPVYPDIDIEIVSNEFATQYFQFPFLYNNTIKNQIIVENA